MRVLAAMSGGVDSAVAAARAVDAGHDVVGVHLALSRDRAQSRVGARGCCTVEDAHDARRSADVLGIPFYVWDLSEEFQEAVVDDFVAEYAAGRTPNPCLRCNEKVKFAALLDKAVALGFDRLVTGHYARVVEAADGRRELHRAVDPDKDQSYVLGVLTADQLARADFPLGDTAKADVRGEAARRGLAVADKPDSHDICFVPDGDTRTWLGARIGRHPGDVLDTSGQVVGRHDGAHAFTVGQRRGLALTRPAADGRPRYVVATDPQAGTVTVGPAEDLDVDLVVGRQPRWCGEAPDGAVDVLAQVRAHGEPVPATAAVVGDQVEVRLHQPLRAVAAGQAVVLYEGSRVLGSATVVQARRLAS